MALQKLTDPAQHLINLERLVDNPPPNISIVPQTIKDSDKFAYYCEYDYDSWKPPKERVAWVEKYASGKTLDIGCGAYPITTNACSTYKVGVDISLKAATKASEYLDEVWLLDIDNAQPQDLEGLARFDTIVHSETLEHFEHPQQVLENTYKLLADDGKLIVTYPNKMSFAMAVDYAANGGEFKHFKEFHRGHISIVRKPELEQMFDKAGFEIVEEDFRESGLVAYGRTAFPKGKMWKEICKLAPSILGHQFFYVLKKKK